MRARWLHSFSGSMPLHMARPTAAAASAAASCKTCQSVSAGEGFVSFGAASFVTSTRLPEPALYSVLRQQCVRYALRRVSWQTQTTDLVTQLTVV